MNSLLKFFFVPFVAVSVGIAACGSSNSDSTANESGGDDTTTSSTNELAVAFPDDLAVSSPTASSSSGSALIAALLRNQEGGAGPNYVQPMPFNEKKDAMTTLLTPPAAGGGPPTIPPGAMNFEKGAPPMQCFGPPLYWEGDHPDGDNATNPLPPLDLGFWIAEEASTGEACPAAVANSIMGEIENYLNMIMVPAATLSVAATENTALPAKGSEVDLAEFAGEVVEGNELPMDIATTTLGREAVDTSEGFPVFVTNVTGTIDVPIIDGVTADEAPTFEMTIRHIPEVSMDETSTLVKAQEDGSTTNDDTYCGIFQQKVDLPTDPLNDNFEGLSGRTQCISIAYCKNSATSMTTLLKKAEFPPDANCFDSNGEVTTTAAQQPEPGGGPGEDDGPPPEGEGGPGPGPEGPPPGPGGPPPGLIRAQEAEVDGWLANYYYILAEINPETNGTGSVAQAWVAGAQDALSRVTNVVTSVESDGTVTGCGYYGFGVRVDSETGTIGKISNTICNWTGPGGAIASMDYTGMPKAQRQCFTKNTAGIFVTDEDDEINITYAPTNSCDKAAGTFAYGLTDPPTDVGADTAVTNDLVDLPISFTVPDVPISE